MKGRLSPVLIMRATFLLSVVLLFASSCQLFHFDKINPYNDLTSDHLHKYDVNKISIVFPDTMAIYPGSSFPIGVIAVSGRKELKTRGFSNGFVNWNSYAVRVEGGSFDKGIVTVNFDPRIIANHFKIIVTPYYFPGLKQEIEIPISYKTKFIAYCRGQNGHGGVNGLSGEELHQIHGTTDKFYRGYNGQAGTNGETATDGCMVDVFVKAMNADDKQLMNVLVINHCDNSRSVFWIDPDGGALVVDVSGGNGGDGGYGGDGENGTNGIAPNYYYPAVASYPDPAWPYDPGFYLPGYSVSQYDAYYNPVGGDGGIGGNGGDAGYGGNGGVAVVHLDSSAVQWKGKIYIENKGGISGKAGAGGYAGRGGIGAYVNTRRIDGKTGYIGAPGIKAKNGKPGGETEWRIEKVKMKW